MPVTATKWHLRSEPIHCWIRSITLGICTASTRTPSTLKFGLVLRIGLIRDSIGSDSTQHKGYCLSEARNHTLITPIGYSFASVMTHSISKLRVSQYPGK